MNNDASNIMKSRYAKKAARVKTKEIRRKYRQEAVSYTHLDVYKRQLISSGASNL